VRPNRKPIFGRERRRRAYVVWLGPVTIRTETGSGWDLTFAFQWHRFAFGWTIVRAAPLDA
jgi:hypothetical protein